MVSLACTTTRTDGVTLVTARLENPDRPRRVRVENRLDGPVWPPRRRGVPAAGWTESGFECVLAADETRALGYACPAPADDPPLAVVETDPVDPADDETAFEPVADVPSVDDTPTDVVRALGSPRPPRDAVPVPDTTEETGAADPEASPATASPSEPTPAGAASADQTASRTTAATTADDGQPTEPPVEAVQAWLAGIEARLELADEVSGTTRLAVVADALERAGGVAGVRDVAEQLDADAQKLRQVAERATALADRAESATVPVEDIERLR